jgi:AcrR family transcriptional regulator
VRGEKRIGIPLANGSPTGGQGRSVNFSAVFARGNRRFDDQMEGRVMSATEKKNLDQERALGRRNQVLDAAECCFGRSGFHGASMAEISKAAGMSAGHIYNYFDSKDAIIAAFVQQNMERVSAIIRDLEQRDDPLQAILDGLEDKVREQLDPCTWKLPLEIFAEASRNPKIALLVQDADRYTRRAFGAILKKGREQRGLASGDALLDGRIEVIIAIFQGLHLRALNNPSQTESALVDAARLALAPLLFGE